jgi:hypothetical protein
MLMVVISVYFIPILLPVEHEDSIIVSAAENIRQRWVHHDMPDKVRVLVRNGLQFLTCVVVVHSDTAVIRAHDNPLLASDKLCASDWSIRDLETLHLAL